MKKKLICVLGGLWLAAPLLMAQTKDPLPPAPVTDSAVAAAPVTNSALNAELFYQLLVGEISTQEGEPAAGYALMLDAARKTDEAQLYQRAADIALQSRSGDAALQAVKAWKQAQPQSREANRYLMQILIALNRISDTSEPVKTEIELTPAADRARVISAIPRAYTRVSDKKQASAVVEEALALYLINPDTASVAWTTVARMRLAAGDAPGALDAAKKAQAAEPKAEGPTLVAMELIDPKLPEAEALVKTYLARNPQSAPELHMVYARALLDAQRYAEATGQLQIVIRDKPDLAPAWLVLGSLQLQDNQLATAQTSLEKYVVLATQQSNQEESARGLSQAYLALAHLWRREFRLFNYRFHIPDGRETLWQIVIGAIDLAFAGGALYLLLPDAGVPALLTFWTIYAVAMLAGALSHSPGGLGVFEGVMLLLMPLAPKAGVLAALVLFRMIYTYIPFLLGLIVIAVLEWRALRARRQSAM